MTKYNPKRVGMGKGMGRGYHNLLLTDSRIHYLSAKGIKIKQPVFRADKLGHAPLEITLYVPSTEKDAKGEDRVIRDEDFLKRIDEAENEMIDLFEGYTRVSADGGWYNKEKKEYIKEPVATVTSFTGVKKFEENRKKFEDYVEDIRDRYDQDSISIEFEGDLFFYEKPKKTNGEWTVEFDKPDDYLWQHNGEYVSVVGVDLPPDKHEYVFQVFDTNKNKNLIKTNYKKEKDALERAKKYMRDNPKGIQKD